MSYSLLCEANWPIKLRYAVKSMRSQAIHLFIFYFSLRGGNLVPRVLWLLGQWVNVGRASEEMAKTNVFFIACSGLFTVTKLRIVNCSLSPRPTSLRSLVRDRHGWGEETL